MYETLYKALGPQHWWPGETPEEVIVGAILTQNTAWVNVERAIDNLKRAKCLTLRALHDIDEGKLAKLIRPSGYFRLKAKRLKAAVRWIAENYDGDLGAMFAQDPARLREELLGVYGLGPETVDSILLYAGGVTTFVVDTYTTRILRRHFLLDDAASYDETKELFEANLPAEAALFNEYHALLVAVGKDYCKPKARCDSCPLRRWRHDPER